MKILRKIGLATLLIGMPVAALGQTSAVGPAAAATSSDHSSLLLESGTGRVLTLREPAANVFVADPKIAEVRPASAAALFVFGVAAGRTTVAALDAAGHTIAQYDVTVQPSAFGAIQTQSLIARLVAGSRVQVQAQSKGLLLSGVVGSAADAAQAVAIAKGYVGDAQIVENQISVASPIQVTLRVRIAEISREVVRNLGVNWQAIGTIGSIAKLPALNLAANGVGAASCAAGTLFSLSCQGGNFNAVIDALASDNLARVLAEPNLTVMSGQPASFLVGGQYPIPVAQQNNAISVDYKNYGVSLSFLPTVFSDGRINLHVAPEVSKLSNQNAVTVAAGSSSFTIPALTVSRAETTVELGSGQSFAIAGLLQTDHTQGNTGLPGLGDVPVLGALFRDNSFDNKETELVIIVTPYIVRPVNDPSSLHLPTDGYTAPREIDRLLFMRQVGHGQPAVPVSIPGSAGFIVQ
ncbi:MAG TPA: type II and III secretion system protein family protein [Acetobacteraceae bacterium]|jgi:pilus assembly protein CpaC|nr:type II and III secretion system protein family protein [Acetobacteraceae bacterium]